MTLLYLKETPSEYEPPGFKACDFEKYNYVKGCETLKAGVVSSHWHSVKMEFHVPQANIKYMEQYDETFNDTANESKNNIDSSQSFKPITQSRKFRLKDIEEEEIVNIDEIDNMHPIKQNEKLESKPQMAVYKSGKSSGSKTNEKIHAIKMTEEENKKQSVLEVKNKKTKVIKPKKEDYENSKLILQMKELSVAQSPSLISSSNNRLTQQSLPQLDEIG